MNQGNRMSVKNKAKPKNKNVKNKRSRRKNKQQTTVVNRIGMDPSERVTLKYISETTVESGIAYDILLFNGNNTFDKRPAILTESLLYLSIYNRFYSLNRVERVRVKLTVSNKDSYQLVVGIYPSIAQIPVPGSTGDVRGYLEDTFASSMVLAPQGSGKDTETLFYDLSLRKVIGQPREYDDSQYYTSTSTSGPYYTIYLSLVSYSTGGSVKYDFTWEEEDDIVFYWKNVITDATYAGLPREIVPRDNYSTCPQKDKTVVVPQRPPFRVGPFSGRPPDKV